MNMGAAASQEKAGKPDALYHDRRTNIQLACSTLEVYGGAKGAAAF
jgi:hypothetical protein